MSESFQFEIDPLKISESYLGGVLVALDVLSFSEEEYPGEPEDPICLIAAAHTTGLSSISKVYTKLFVASDPSIFEEGQVIKNFYTYLDMFEGGTLVTHYGCGKSLDDGFDIPYMLLRVRDNHPEVYPGLKRALLKFREHDTCSYVKSKMNLPSPELDYVESFYGLIRKPDAELSGDVRSCMAAYWKAGQGDVLKHGITNVYNCIRIAQSQIKKTICCTDIPL
ncbi:hypothetical protein CUJ83_06725 [Methanocella sp. CWC-04]|uniref:Uncharacterized protein n=1 Tax=Methanooceanicella nereidis TaxID=2052831 RepID=A0AAP2RC03_9EURY|nr:hypothetical protein [Methanocella sp. CWC-04]MCD1294693.1 hypothetical protein [Methanocella sp. CWC-04]